MTVDAPWLSAPHTHTAPETREDVRSGIPSPSSSFHPQSLLLFLHPPPTCYPEAFLLPPSYLVLC